MKPRKPLPRSTKPIKRSRLKKRLGRKGRKSMEAIRALKRWFFGEGLFAVCQWCGQEVSHFGCHFHHKVKRSWGGKDVKENLVCLHPHCHSQIHNDQRLLLHVRDASANLANKETLTRPDQI